MPTHALRPSQPVQNLAPEWQNRRRRRRYESYADYAVIPDKSISTKTEENRSNETRQFVNSNRNIPQSNDFKRMTSETNNFTECDSITEQNPSCIKSNDIKKVSTVSKNNIVRGPMSVNKEKEFLTKENIESNQKSNKNLEMCAIHSKNTKEKKESQSMTEGSSLLQNLKNESYTQIDGNVSDKEITKTISSRSANGTSNSLYLNDPDLSNKCVSLGKKKINQNKSKEKSDKKVDIRSLTKDESLHDLTDSNQEINNESKTASFTPEESIAVVNSSTTEVIQETKLQSSLPDILSALNKSQPNENHSSSGNSLPDNADLDKGTTSKPKSFLSQTTYLPNLLSSEALQNEMEMELKQLQNLHSLQANQSIYKLAYDENVTDQSEADSRSPSPMDPESQVPSSITSAEILIHEADSGSDAGSEDVELLPHRYESETFLNESKHVYVNKLSLAVELLRTQENLPYDDEFKRVVGENQSSAIVPGVHTTGKVNLGFVEDSFSPNSRSITKHSENKIATTNVPEVAQYQLNYSANSSNDSAIFSDIEFDNLDDDLCEAAKEAVAQGGETQDNTEEIRAGYRRIGVRHYFSPRANFSLNPCFCCSIM